MEQREKLMKLIREFLSKSDDGENMTDLADYLLANDVVALPCRCIKCIYFDRGRWMCKRQVCMETHSYGFCDFGELKDGDE